MLGATLALSALPLFISSYHGVVLLIVSSTVTMFLVEGVWGVIPAHLTEMSPDAIRGFYPGVTYQIGNLLASLNIPIQDSLTPSALLSVHPGRDTWPGACPGHHRDRDRKGAKGQGVRRRGWSRHCVRGSNPGPGAERR